MRGCLPREEVHLPRLGRMASMNVGLAQSNADAGSTHAAARELEINTESLLDLWERLGRRGPSLTALETEDVSGAVLRERYLRPLARVLIGGLRGSAPHAAVYHEERLRYLDSRLGHFERIELLGEMLGEEIEAIAALIARDDGRDEVAATLKQFHQPLLAAPPGSTSLLLIGDCLFTEARAFLAARPERSNTPLDIRQIFFSARRPIDARNNAILQEVADGKPAMIGLSLFTFEGIPPWTSCFQQAAAWWRGQEAVSRVPGFVEIVRETIGDIRSVSDVPIVVHAPCGLPLDRYRRRLPIVPPHSRHQRALVERLREGLSELVESTENTILLDEPDLVHRAGGLRTVGRRVFDPDDIGDAYFHTSHLGDIVAGHYEGLARDLSVFGRAKALFVDFDNTLWQGVMGDGSVEHDVERQELLRQLKEAGVLLIALSKNDPTAIRWDEMVLTPEDFVLHKINWEPKPDNVASALQALDLAPEAFVLIDDNPAERALVSEQVTGVRALDPDDPKTWLALARWLQFPSTKQTEEARQRTEMYRQAAERREALGGGHDYAAMMASLDLTYEIRPARLSDLDRLVELVQRTNQFNTTTRRRSRGELEQLISSSSHELLVASLGDRFGNLGIVATVIVDIPRRNIDSVIMSCRAMGFGLEMAVLHDAMTCLDGDGAVTGEFVPTDRNRPAADLFRQAGFTEHADGQWTIGADRTAWPQVPSWLAAGA